jgi:hypothetical protein
MQKTEKSQLAKELYYCTSSPFDKLKIVQMRIQAPIFANWKMNTYIIILDMVAKDLLFSILKI